MSYVGHKSRAFRDFGDVPIVVRKRSEGRMKTYPSATDARSWCDETEERRQYILELIRADHEKVAIGKYVPIEVLIDTLLANKNADIERLQKLLDMYSKLNLTPDQKRMLDGMKDELEQSEKARLGGKGRVGGEGGIGAQSGAGMGGIGGKGIGAGAGGAGGTAGGAGGTAGGAGGTAGGAGGTAGGAGGSAWGIDGSAGGAGGSAWGVDESAGGAGGSAWGVEGSAGGAGGSAGGVGGSEGTAGGGKGGPGGGVGPAGAKAGAAGVGGSAGAGGVGGKGGAGAGMDSKVSWENVADKQTADGRPIAEVESKCSAKSRSVCSAASKGGKGGAEGAGTITAASLANMNPKQLKDLVLQKDAELAAKQAECDQQYKIARAAIEQLETLKDIMDERDTLKKKLEESVHELETLRNRVQDPCVGEIAALEEEIERLRVKGQLSPAEETEVIRKEIEVLKKYCAKLSTIQEENNRLKTQVERLHELSGIPGNYQDSAEESNDPAELKGKLKDLKQKFAKLDEIMGERDKLKKRVKQLEDELSKYGGLPEEIEVFKRRSQLLDDVLDERKNLQERLDKVRGLEEELIALKKKADRVDQLERQVKEVNGEIGRVRRSSAIEIENMKNQKDDAQKESDGIKSEREMLRKKAADSACAEEELERLRYRAREAEALRIERDRLKVRLDELAAIECEFMQLLDKTKCLESIKCEREMYKAKYEELLGLECECDMLRAQVERCKQADKERDGLIRQLRDCECCIADQEDEIKKLVSHIDRLSHGSNQQQDRMQRALCDMRSDLENKSSLIAVSEEKLAGVQNQLKHTIAEVSCETSCLRARIEDLENQLREAKRTIKENKDEICKLGGKIEEKDGLIHSLSEELQVSGSKNEVIASLQRELQQTKDLDGDEHYETMLRQSKTAVKRVAEELGKHYEEWDSMKETKLSGDVGELQNRIKELEEQLAKANATITQLREGVGVTDRLSAENLALRRHSNEVQKVAKDQIEELVEHLRKAKERIAELEAQNAALLQSLAEAGADGAAAARPSTDAATDLPPAAASVDAEVAAPPAAVLTEAATAPPTGGGEEEARLRKMLEDMEQEKNKLEKTLEQCQQEQEQGGPDLDALRAEIARLEGQLQNEIKLRKEAEEKLKADDTSAAATADLEAELLKLKEQNEQLKVAAKDAGTSAEDDGRYAELESANAKLLQQIADLQQQLENAKSAAGDNAELDALRQENAALLAQIADQKNEIGNLIDKAAGPEVGDMLEKERKEKEDLQNLIKSLQGQISGMEQETAAAPPPVSSPDSSSVNDAIARLTAQLEAEQAKAAAAEDSLKRLQAEKPAEPSAAVADNSQEIADLKNRIQKLEEENSALKASSGGDNTPLLNEIENLKSKISELELQLEACKSKVNDLESQNNQLLSAAGGDDSPLLAQIDDLKKKVSDLEAENMELKGKLSKMQSEISSLKRTSQDMASDYSAQIKRLSETYEDKLKASSESLQTIEETMNLSEDAAAAVQKMKDSYESEIERLKKELQRQKKECTDTIASLKSQQDRDSKNLHNKYNDGVAKLQGSHEEILRDIGKEHEKEVDSLRSELRMSKEAIENLEKRAKSVSISEGTMAQKQPSLTVKTVDTVDIKPDAREKKGEGVCTCGTGLETILHKILNNGIESLVFQELQFLHNKTCEATAKILGRSKSGPPCPCSPSPGPPHSHDVSPTRADRMLLVKKISSLENDLMRKQRHAQQKVGALQIAIKTERQHLEDLKNMLDTERQRNGELMCKIGAQSRAVASMEAERDIMRKKTSFHEEKLQELLINCEEEKSRVKILEEDLYMAKQRLKKDACTMESMRIKLEQTVTSEMMLKMQLDQHTRGKMPKSPCPCKRQALVSAQKSPTPQIPTDSQTTSFYTELTVQDIKRKRNFVHQCCMKHHEGFERGKRSSSAHRPCSRKGNMSDVD